MKAKERVGRKAAEFVEDKTVVGIGTGSTAAYFIDELARRVRDEDLNLTLVSTSAQSTDQAQRLGMAVTDLSQVEAIDLTIDGVDEFTADCQGIKGGGGALLIEKIIAVNSSRVIWIAEEKKLVDQLAFPLPVEVVPTGSTQLLKRLDNLGYKPTFRRKKDGSLFVTDSHNYIIDLHQEPIRDPYALQNQLIPMVGVVEQGLFLDIADDVLVANDEETYLLSERKTRP